MLKRTLIAILLSYLCAGMALAGGYTRGGGARRPVAYFPLSISGTVDPDDLAAATACWNFDSAVGGNYTDDCAGLYTMTVNGAPTLESHDGTWPNGLSGAAGKAWKMNGGWLSRADDDSFDMDLTNNPGGDFSVQFVVVPNNITGSGYILSKFDAGGNQRAWGITVNADDILVYVSNNGTTFTTTTSLACLAAHRPAFVTYTYQYVGAANSVGTIYVDNLTTATSNTQQGPIIDSTADFNVAARHGGGGLYDGLLSDCTLFKGVARTEADHDAAFARWQGRNSAGNDDIVVSVASASPPAIQQKPCATEDGCFIDQPANSGAVGVHGELSSTALNSKWWRGSVETCAAGHPTGWVISENVGGGGATVVIDCDSTTSAHGGTSIKFTADGGGIPKNAYAFGACQTNWINQDVTEIAYGITTSGTASCLVRLREYDTAACGVLLSDNTLWGAGSPGANWTELKGTMAAGAWNVATSSWKPYIHCVATGTGYTVNFDAAMALQAPATFATDAVCTSDSDSDAVCTATIPSITSPFSANGAMTVEGTWRSPWAGVDLTGNAFLFSDGIPGVANSYTLAVSNVTDEAYFNHYDNAAGLRQIAPNVLNWTANTDYEVRIRTGGNDDIGLFWNAVWNNTAAGAGTGVRSAAQTTTHIGSSNVIPAGVWTRELYIYPRTRF